MLEQIENHGQHLHRAIEKTSCDRHNAPTGVPCWHMPKQAEGTEGYYASICGKRIRKAGFIGKISASSMRVRAPQKDDDPKSGPRRSFSKKKTNAPRSPRRDK
jgi:hypothetical protein